MKIINLSGIKCECGTIIPQQYVHDNDLVMFCEEKGTKVGAAVLMQREDDWVLNWLWIVPDARGKGYGSALLDEAIENVKKMGGKSLYIYINEKSPEKDRFLYMLTGRNFFLNKELIPKAYVTRDQLKRAVFFTDPKYKHKGNSSQIAISSLRQLGRQGIKKFISQSDKRQNYLVSRADYDNADIDLSFCLLHKDTVVGMVLIHPTSQDDEKSLSLCYVDSKYMLKIVPLLKEVAEELLRQPNKIERLSFYCIEENVVRLVDHVFPEKKLCMETIIEGQKFIF